LIVVGAALLKLPGSRNFDPLTGELAQGCSLSVEAAVLLLQQCFKMLPFAAELSWRSKRRGLVSLPENVAIC
jgi:hypothetical protein